MTAPPDDGTLFRCECCRLRTCREKKRGWGYVCDDCFDHYASAGTWTEVPRLQIEAEHERMRAQAARETGATTVPPGGGDPCPHGCGHPLDPHLMEATWFETRETPDGPETTLTIPAGGVMTCPEPGCTCRSTWSIEQGEPDANGESAP